jgi:serine protease inhibitor
MDLDLHINEELAQLGLKYSGFFNQEEITDPVLWIKEVFKKNFIEIVQKGIDAEKSAAIQNAFFETQEQIKNIDLSGIE